MRAATLGSDTAGSSSGSTAREERAPAESPTGPNAWGPPSPRQIYAACAAFLGLTQPSRSRSDASVTSSPTSPRAHCYPSRTFYQSAGGTQVSRGLPPVRTVRPSADSGAPRATRSFSLLIRAQQGRHVGGRRSMRSDGCVALFWQASASHGQGVGPRSRLRTGRSASTLLRR